MVWICWSTYKATLSGGLSRLSVRFNPLHMLQSRRALLNLAEPVYRTHLQYLKRLVSAVMSANECIETVRECLQRGASHYILKPVTQKEIKSLWQYAYRSATRPAPVPDEPGVPASPSPSGSVPAHLIDISTIATKAAPLPRKTETRAPSPTGATLAPAGTNMPLNSALETLSLPWRIRLTIFSQLLHNTRIAFDTAAPGLDTIRLPSRTQAFSKPAAVLISSSSGAIAPCHTPPHHFSSHYYRAPAARGTSMAMHFPQRYDSAAATYALGVLLLELAMAPCPAKVRAEYLAALPRVPSSLLTAKPEIAVLILRMTAANAADRPTLAQITRERAVYAVYSTVAAAESVVANQEAAGSVAIRRSFLQKVQESRQASIAAVTADLECIDADLSRVGSLPLCSSLLHTYSRGIAEHSSRGIHGRGVHRAQLGASLAFLYPRLVHCSWSGSGIVPLQPGLRTDLQECHQGRAQAGWEMHGLNVSDVVQVHTALWHVQSEASGVTVATMGGEHGKDGIADGTAAGPDSAPGAGADAPASRPAHISWPRRRRTRDSPHSAASTSPRLEAPTISGSVHDGSEENDCDVNAAPAAIVRVAGEGFPDGGETVCMEEPGDEAPSKRQRVDDLPPAHPGSASDSGKTQAMEVQKGCSCRSDDVTTLSKMHGDGDCARSRITSKDAQEVPRRASEHCLDGTKRGGVVRSSPREGQGEKGGTNHEAATQPVSEAVRDRWDHVESLSMQLFGGYRDAARRGRMAHEGRSEAVGGTAAGAAAGAADPQLQTAPWLRAVASDLQAVARFRWLPVVSSVQHAPSSTLDGSSGRRMVCAVVLDRCEENLAVIGAVSPAPAPPMFGAAILSV